MAEIAIPLIHEGHDTHHKQQIGYELLSNGAFSIEATTGDEGMTTIVTRRLTATPEGRMASTSSIYVVAESDVFLRPTDKGPLLVVQLPQMLQEQSAA